jgi:uncharacterized UBP type Zn finger protein
MKGLKKIKNLKNTCYINSVVQLVAHIQPIFKKLCQDYDSEMIEDNS